MERPYMKPRKRKTADWDKISVEDIKNLSNRLRRIKDAETGR